MNWNTDWVISAIDVLNDFWIATERRFVGDSLSSNLSRLLNLNEDFIISSYNITYLIISQSTIPIRSPQFPPLQHLQTESTPTPIDLSGRVANSPWSWGPSQRTFSWFDCATSMSLRGRSWLTISLMCFRNCCCRLGQVIAPRNRTLIICHPNRLQTLLNHFYASFPATKLRSNSEWPCDVRIAPRTPQLSWKCCSIPLSNL